MINNNCPCKRKKCERYGNCEACLAHHKNKKHPPYCERKKLTNEKTGLPR